MLVTNLGTLYGFASTGTCNGRANLHQSQDNKHAIDLGRISGFPPTDLPREQLQYFGSFVTRMECTWDMHSVAAGHACSALRANGYRKGILCICVPFKGTQSPKWQRSEFPHRPSIYRSAARHQAQRLEQSRDAWRPRGRFRPPRSGARRTHAVPRGR